MKTRRAQYPKGSIRRVFRANGFAWEVRFSEYLNGKRRQKCMTFAPSDYPTEASVRKAIEQQVILQNSKTQRVKVGAGFGALHTLPSRTSANAAALDPGRQGILAPRLHRAAVVRQSAS